MSASLAFIYSTDKLSGKLTKYFTGSYCYHVGWVVENPTTKEPEFFDMNLLRRVRPWPYYSPEHVKLVGVPVNITWDYLYGKLKSDDNVYGSIDYMLFGLRKLYHLFGKSTPNAKGVICSEMVYNDLVANGWDKTFTEVPSPADLEKEFLNDAAN